MNLYNGLPFRVSLIQDGHHLNVNIANINIAIGQMGFKAKELIFVVVVDENYQIISDTFHNNFCLKP